MTTNHLHNVSDSGLGQRALVTRLGAARHHGADGSRADVLPVPQQQPPQTIEEHLNSALYLPDLFPSLYSLVLKTPESLFHMLSVFLEGNKTLNPYKTPSGGS